MKQNILDHLPSTINVHANKVNKIRLWAPSKSMHCYLIPWVYLIHPFSVIFMLPGIDMDSAGGRIEHIILNRTSLNRASDRRRGLLSNSEIEP